MRFLIIILIFLSQVACASTVVITPPPARQVMLPPPGFTACEIKPAGLYHGTWYEERRICHYRGPRGGTAIWTSGFWKCPNLHKVCKAWIWVPGQLDAHPMAGFSRPTTVVYVR
jgi:hypothetical protein